MAVMGAEMQGKSVQLVVQRPNQKGYRILSGVMKMSDLEQAQLSACFNELIASMQSKVDNSAANFQK